MIDYTITNNNIHVQDSAFIEKSLIKPFLQNLKNRYSSKNYEVLKRSNFSMVNEWLAHNLLYMMNIQRERTKDVDLDYPQKWYYKVGYFILGLIGRIVCK